MYSNREWILCQTLPAQRPPVKRPSVRNHNVGRERHAYPLGDEGVDEAAAQLGGHLPAGGRPRPAAHRQRDPGVAHRLDAGGPWRLADQRLAERGIYVRAQNRGLLAEEASEAYKDVAQVVDVLHDAGIADRVARMRPIGVVKG